MSLQDDPRLAESRAIPADELIDRLGIAGLKRQGAERVGPCPICGGTDRFAVNVRTNMALCRQCGLRAGDQVGLVQGVLGLPFRDALKWLMGEPVAEMSSAEIARRREKAEAARRKQEAEAARYRAAAQRHAVRIWHGAEPGVSPEVASYLEGRGFRPDVVASLGPVLRSAPRHPYVRKIGGEAVVLHTGPAMLARISTPTERVAAVHQTWIDPYRPGKKAEVAARAEDNGGAPWPAKIVRGAAKGGVIPLRVSREGPIVMGEGIETTLTALQDDPVPGAAYWCGVSLGNIAGRMQRVPGRRHSGLPDMTDTDAFVPPAWCTRLVLIQDGDSAPAETRAKLMACAQRAMALVPGLKAQIVHPGEGVDLNDLIQPTGGAS